MVVGVGVSVEDFGGTNGWRPALSVERGWDVKQTGCS